MNKQLALKSHAQLSLSVRPFLRDLGHVPIIDKNSRGKDIVPMAPHEASRYKERSVVERFNSRLKEEFGGRNIMVRGAQKVKMHLMFGVVAIFADHLIKLAT